MGTAVAVLTPKDVPALLSREAVKARIVPFLPKGADYERVIAAVQMVLTDNPALQKCTLVSLVRAIAKVQQWGLEIGETAHLVPFKDVAVPVADYKGLAQLVIATGMVRHIETRSVYEKEHFRIEYGLEPKLEHVPLYRALDRGPLIGAYAVFFLPFGNRSFRFVGIEEVDAIRKKYSRQWKDGPCPAFYAEKTALRQGVKLLPKDRRLTDALRVIREEEHEELEHVPAPGESPVINNLGDPPTNVDAETGEVRSPDEYPGDEFAQ